jgi:FixJ family two-component response regulator
MSACQSTVFVVDDDLSVCKSLSRLLRSSGYAVATFSSASDFLASGRQGESASCLVLDVSMPGFSGMELQERLRRLHSTLPIVFITGHGDIPMSVRAMKGGAVDFLPKPFEDVQLLDAVAKAIARGIRDRRERIELESIQQRFERLTPRERQVMELVVAGMLNKQAADELGTVEKTIKVHRARVMEKMGVHCLADLVRLSERLQRKAPPAAMP